MTARVGGTWAAQARFMRTVLLVASLVAAPALAQASIFPDANTKKAARQLELANVSEESRAFIKSKMKNHGKELRDLSIAVATLRLSEVQRLAQGMANEPRLDSSSGPAMKLPPRFFELSATEQNFSQVMGNCIACHATFKK